MDFYNFDLILDYLVNSGFVELIIPFVVLFTLLFIASSQTHFFNKAISGLFSAAVTLMVIIPHVIGRYQRCWDFVDIMNRGLPKLGIFILAVIVLIVLMLIIGIDTDKLKNHPRILFLLTIIAITYITFTSKPRGCDTLDMQIPWGWLIIGAIIIIPTLFWKKSRQ